MFSLKSMTKLEDLTVPLTSDQICWRLKLQIHSANRKQEPAAMINKKQENFDKIHRDNINKRKRIHVQ